MNTQKIFIDRLTNLMEKYDMTQVELAKRIGTTNVTISRYLTGERMPRIELVIKMANVFETTVDYLLGITDVRRFNDGNVNKSTLEMQNAFEDLGLISSNKDLTKSQVDMIKKLIELNKDFILAAENKTEGIA